jgi:BASS family bile acid:Na+ symporter
MGQLNALINILLTIALIEMMISIGLGVTVSEVMRVAKDRRLVTQALVANYLLVPAATVGLLILFHAKPMVAAGFLIVAVCPGAPYAAPFTAIARGNVAAAVGLMVILAASSAIVAPILLGLLLPLLSGDQPLNIDALKLVTTLMVTQLLPLAAGIAVRERRALLASKLLKPAGRIAALLNGLVILLILVAQFRSLAEIRLMAFVGMFCLLIASVGAGWLLGGSGLESQKAMSITTAVRNVGVALVIAAGSFPGTAAVTAALAYGLFQTIGVALLAVASSRMTQPRAFPVNT